MTGGTSKGPQLAVNTGCRPKVLTLKPQRTISSESKSKKEADRSEPSRVVWAFR